MIYPHSIDQAKSDGFCIVDIRNKEESALRPLPQADVIIAMGELLEQPAEHLNPETPYLLVCAAGGRTRYAAALLSQQGYDNIWAFPSTW
ncbi:rhodanese-like domain-containing protein [Suttonella sp. R2A3]|uniref:rhodanese-like domain-containing protein n=1 Tax=Suttonella sp. R2A3 TaxID=2908648 RepID=UPI001F3708A3|nr:rhodanese-like domain-containing protein [Suttonella sp. R2A3]UJF24520.1 rhodanese-like domain-containing protein [Suttonella sp. R2A3]